MNKNGARIVVCGSGNFDEESFVVGFLNATKSMLRIDTIYSGEFTGVAQFAREWALHNGVAYKAHNFFSGEKNASFFETHNLPEFVVENDKYFIKGKEFFLEEGIDILCPFPNRKGELGASTQNISRMAKLAGVTIFDTLDIYHDANVKQISSEIKDVIHQEQNVALPENAGKIEVAQPVLKNRRKF